MRARISRYDGAVMSTLDTIDNEILHEYDSDDLDVLEEESVDAEVLATKLFGSDRFNRVDDNDGDDGIVNEHTESQRGLMVEESYDVEDIGERQRLFYDYPSFSDISEWCVGGDERLGHGGPKEPRDLFKGQRFVTKDAVVHACQAYSIQNRVEYRVDKSEPCLLNLKCRLDGEEGGKCKWHFRAVKKKKSCMFEVTIFDEQHTCEVEIIPSDNVHLNKNFIGWEMKDHIEEKLRITPRRIRKDMKLKYGFEVSYLKAWKGKQKAMEILFGDWVKSFEMLPAYMDVLCQKNPGTCVFWNRRQVDENKVYVDRVFWSFAPAIEAFKSCRAVLSVDGTHLYGRYKGTLLVAVALDANNHVLPIAFALVESENNDSWGWFMRCIRTGVTSREGLCVISDRHNGILNAMTMPDWSPPKAYHRFCVRHFASNFMTRVRSTEKKKFLSKIAYEPQQKILDKKFKDLLEIVKSDKDTFTWLRNTPTEKWTLAYDSDGRRWGSMTTNASEVFNGVLKGGRDLPITALVHYTFKQTNDYFVSRRVQYRDHTKSYSPVIEKIIDEMIDPAMTQEVTLFNREDVDASVRIHGTNLKYEVNLTRQTCSCERWQALHYPCTHVIAVGSKVHLSKYYGVADEYKMTAYYKTWGPIFHPIPDVAVWDVQPHPLHIPNPHFIRPPKRGRMCSKRRPNEMDGVGNGRATSSTLIRGKKKACGLCKEHGHNRLGCRLRGQIH